MVKLSEGKTLQELAGIVGSSDFEALKGFVGALGMSSDEQRSLLGSLKSLTSITESAPTLIRMDAWK